MRKKKDADLRRDADLGGNYARDTHRGGYGDAYAREGATGVGTAARADAYGDSTTKRQPKLRKIGKARE